MIELSTYSLRVLRNDKELNLYRGSREHDDSQILALSPAMEYPASETLKRLEHEYSLREELDPAWAALTLPGTLSTTGHFDQSKSGIVAHCCSHSRTTI